MNQNPNLKTKKIKLRKKDFTKRLKMKKEETL